MRVLVAADDPWTRVVLSESLAAAGCTVEHASNGTAALRLIAERVPDIALLSRRLPEIDTHDVLRALRADARTRHVGVVLIDDARPARAVGAAPGAPSAPGAVVSTNPAEVLGSVVDALSHATQAAPRPRRTRCRAQAGAPAAAVVVAVGVPTRSVSASRPAWPLVRVSRSRGTSRMRNPGRSGKWRFSNGIETL